LLLGHAGNVHFHERIFADGKADIIFNFGVSYQRGSFETEATPQVIRITHLDAQRAYPLMISQVGAIHLIGVRFRLGALQAFLDRKPLSELTGEIVDLDDIFGKQGRILEDQLYNLKQDFNAQVKLLDDFFLSRLQPKTPKIPIDILSTKLVSQPIYQISKEMGYSERTLHRLVTQQTGFSPSLLARLLRFQKALTLLNDPNLTLASVAYQCGYYDQAHFSKDFKEFAGISPSPYRVNSSQ
jgi:AraC-like DNA-binding protein